MKGVTASKQGWHEARRLGFVHRVVCAFVRRSEGVGGRGKSC
jgi:hypothetical protein